MHLDAQICCKNELCLFVSRVYEVHVSALNYEVLTRLDLLARF